MHIVNDSLQLYFKSPADISYTTDKNALKKIIRKASFKLIDSVLIYGKADDPPYEYFVTLSQQHKQNYPKKLIVFDTLINSQTITFIGNPLSENSASTLKIDLKNIFNSLEIGPSYRKDIGTVMDIVAKYQNSNKFFAALNEISNYPTYDLQEDWLKLQMELTYASFLGNNTAYKSALNKLESRFKPNDTIIEIIKKNSQDTGVIETITNEAKKHKLVMINENHYYPNHRLLVADLLPKLKDIGYTYLAMEALGAKQDSVLNLKNAYPTLSTGFYTAEQNYSNLLRKAKELGYTFVAYENNGQSKDREIGQAENLYNKTFKIDSLGKVLVLAGIDHILEKPTAKGKKRMATVFKENYLIDPLTISQTHLSGYRKESNANYSIISSAFFKDLRLTSTDYLVLNNNTNDLVDKLSTFAYTNNLETEVQVALFYANEILDKLDYHKKVPYYSAILEAGKKYDLPVNKPGAIYLYTFDRIGKRIDKQLITPTELGHN